MPLHYASRLTSLLLAASWLVVGSPGELIGESYQASAARQYRLQRIHSWLLGDVGFGMAAVLAHRILQESDKHLLDPILILAVIQVESRFDQNAVSSAGAQGLMQIVPAVVDELVEEGKIPARSGSNLKDPLVNVRIGVSYLAYLKEMFGDVQIALTAYNSGPTRIRQKLAAREPIPLDYAEKVLTMQRWLEQRLAEV